MKRALAALTIPFLFACNDTPTQVNLEVQPQFATEIGSGATWFFEGVVGSIYGTPAENVALGDVVTGSLTFTITSADQWPADPCYGGYNVEGVWTYTLNGVTYTFADDGSASGRPTCYVGLPHNQIYFDEYDAGTQSWVRSWWLDVFNADATEDFPLDPPALVPGGWPQQFTVWSYPNSSGFIAGLTALYAAPRDPRTKADCMKGGWEKFGFKNQGQCVRFIETGKDSR